MAEKNPEDKGVKKEKNEEKPLEKMTVVELREIAKEIEGITGVHAMKKDDLLAAIKEERGITDQKAEKAEAKKEPKKGKKGPLSTKQIKRKVFELRKEKADARQAKDKSRVDVLRRRINRLKKMTRKAAQG